MKVFKQRGFEIYIALVFMSMTYFYVHMHPDYMSNIDDWTYISYLRQAWPMKGEWNPGKVFPETVGGLIGNIAGIVIYPIIGDYVKSISGVYGIAYAFMVAIYVYCFGKTIRVLFDLRLSELIFTSFVFFFFHFQLTKTSVHNNNYLFKTGGITMGIFYFIPILLCYIMVLYLLRAILSEEFWNKDLQAIVGMIKKRYLFWGWIFLLLYLAEFSNLLNSGILISFIGVAFLFRLVQGIKNKALKKHIIIYLTYFVPFFMFLLCAVSETTGGRAGMFEQLSFTEILNSTAQDISVVWRNVNKTCVVYIGLLCIVALIISVAKNPKDGSEKRIRFAIGLLTGSFLVNFLFLILLTIRLPGYLSYQSVYNGLLIWPVLIGSMSIAYIVRSVEQVRIFIPIVSFVLFFCLLNIPDNVGNGFGLGDRLYDSNDKKRLYYEDDTSIVQQFIEAESGGADEVILHSSVYSGESGMRVALRIRRTLLRHGVITREIEIESVEKD